MSSHRLRELRRDPNNRRFYEHGIWIRHCQESNSQPVPSQVRADSIGPQWLYFLIMRNTTLNGIFLNPSFLSVCRSKCWVFRKFCHCVQFQQEVSSKSPLDLTPTKASRAIRGILCSPVGSTTANSPQRSSSVRRCLSIPRHASVTISTEQLVSPRVIPDQSMISRSCTTQELASWPEMYSSPVRLEHMSSGVIQTPSNK